MKENPSLSSETTAAPPQPQMNPTHRILLVDDDRTTRRLNAFVLNHAGYQVDEAPDGAAAFEALQTGCFDLVITDNTMPKVTGVELLKKMRASQMSLPVIMATGLVPTAEFARHPWLQPDATLQRPYTVEKLLETVSVVLRVADAREAQTPTSLPQRPSANSLEQ
jgi:DNA-binding response OmpR family regulator